MYNRGTDTSHFLGHSFRSLPSHCTNCKTLNNRSLLQRQSMQINAVQHANSSAAPTTHMYALLLVNQNGTFSMVHAQSPKFYKKCKHINM